MPAEEAGAFFDTNVSPYLISTDEDMQDGLIVEGRLKVENPFRAR
jgi:predicted nucleic acid-binding protein